MTIETGQEFFCEKLVSLRKQGTLAEIKSAAKQLANYLKANSINRAGPTITAVFSTEQYGGETVLDTEILIPVDRLFAPEYGYIFKSKFRLINAARLSFTGKPEMLQDTCAEFVRYIQEHKLQYTTTVYKVIPETIKTADREPGDMTIDFYIGVSTSC
jgi:effector-binding domain-containing protein